MFQLLDCIFVSYVNLYTMEMFLARMIYVFHFYLIQVSAMFAPHLVSRRGDDISVIYAESFVIMIPYSGY